MQRLPHRIGDEPREVLVTQINRFLQPPESLVSLAFHRSIGADRKIARLRMLRDRWAKRLMADLMLAAKRADLWALGHPRELGGHGMPFMGYVRVNEVIGRSHHAMQALGTLSLQDSLMLARHGRPEGRERYLKPIVDGEFVPSFAMTEPDVASSDPTRLETRARLEDGVWVISGRKWFTTGAALARYTTVMCRTEEDAPAHDAFSLIIVPTDAVGYRIVRDTPILGIQGGHYEIELLDVHGPFASLLALQAALFEPHRQDREDDQQNLNHGRKRHTEARAILQNLSEKRSIAGVGMLFGFSRQPPESDVAQLAEGHIKTGQKGERQKQDRADG